MALFLLEEVVDGEADDLSRPLERQREYLSHLAGRGRTERSDNVFFAA